MNEKDQYEYIFAVFGEDEAWAYLQEITSDFVNLSTKNEQG